MINQFSAVTKFLPLKRPMQLWVPVLFFLLAGGVLAAIIFATLGYQILYLDRAYPGVSVAGTEVGGMSLAEIETAMTAQSDTYLNRPITIRAGDESWTFTGQQLGLRVDAAATANKAYHVGRKGKFVADLLTHLSLIFTPKQLQPVILYDKGSTNQILHQLTELINYPPQNARLTIHTGADLEVIPARRGRRLHLGGTQPRIEAAIFSNHPQPVVEAFTQEVVPAVTDEDIAPMHQQLQKLLRSPLILSFSTSTDAAEWSLAPDKLAGMITLAEKPDAGGQPQLTITLNREKLTPYLDEIAKTVNQAPSDARFNFNEEKNKLEVVQYSRVGRTLDTDAAYQQISAAVASGNNFVELPIIVTAPAISSENIESLGIEALVSESTSYFKGSSQGRMRNIALAASKFDGVVIQPGQVFSFNEHLGPVTAEEGYDESLIIYGNRTTVGIGGGVCQVSTTAFRTAFFGGFELVERWAHGYRVGWYETNSVPGLDATIYTPDVDFKFRNDTGHHLLIQTYTDLDAGTVTFKFFGTPTNREVIVGDPVQTNVVKHGPPIYEETPDLPEGMMKQVDWAKDGMEVSVSRVVKEGETIIHQDEIVSHYKPWQAVYQVGTGSGS